MNDSIDGGAELADVEWFIEDDVHVHLFVGHADVGWKDRGDDDDPGADAAFPDFTNKFQTSQVRHFLVDDDDIISLGVAVENGQRVYAALDRTEFVMRLGKDKAHRKRDRSGVVHGQYFQRLVHDNTRSSIDHTDDSRRYTKVDKVADVRAALALLSHCQERVKLGSERVSNAEILKAEIQ